MADDKTKPSEESEEEEVVEPSQEEQAPEEPKVEETPQEEPSEEPEAPEEESEKPVSRRERLRVQDLLNKYPDLAKQDVKAPDFRNTVQADEEVYKTLEETTQDFGRNLLQEAEARNNFSTWRKFLQLEDAQVTSKYPELDKSNKEAFHPAVADAMNVKYLRMVGFNPGDPQRGIPPTVQNPDISYREFVESEMEFADELASLKVQDSQKNIAKQAASTGLRPDGSSPKRMNLNKPPEQMTDEELKAVIAQAGM